MQSFLSIRLPDKPIQMSKFKIVLTRLRISFNSTWKMRTLRSLLGVSTLKDRKRPAVFGPKDVTPVSRRAFVGAGDPGIYTRAVIRIAGKTSYQRRFEESFTKSLSRIYCP